ncbi:RHO1 GDP-GTP exchange protein 2 [Conoideocrella luteorostrata]|uniref:RHO1 GDP-GTP exchange protein 2 n=1 Tax=Conoideocrella luteorostrata TaxID=1105319 RepID=A0AAJ0CP28_9HYPO|nr:RHO1 GDP-GTP exchange protein 2 [Conoideocrella luteorostrata]
MFTAGRSLGRRNQPESARARNQFNLQLLHEKLRFRPRDRVDLKLTDNGRELVGEIQLGKPAKKQQKITAILFDHTLLFVYSKRKGKNQYIKAYRRPMTLQLLVILEVGKVIPSWTITQLSSILCWPSGIRETKTEEGLPIMLRCLGKAGYDLTLYATNLAARDRWLGLIEKAQRRLRARADFFTTAILSSNIFEGMWRINSLTPYDGGRVYLLGTNSGVYLVDYINGGQIPKRVLAVANVAQVGILKEYRLLLVLSDATLTSYPLLALGSDEWTSTVTPKVIHNQCNFFKTGSFLGRQMLCCVRNSAISTTIEVFEFDKGYFPFRVSSVKFLRTKLCLSCDNGFETLSLETFELQSLLDQADPSLDFLPQKKKIMPIHIESLDEDFLLNYSEFSFFIDRNGWRMQPEWLIDWEGVPQSFGISRPWILAFEPNFIEFRNIENKVVHYLANKNIRMLHSSPNEMIFAHQGREGEDSVTVINLYGYNRLREMLSYIPICGVPVMSSGTLESL